MNINPEIKEILREFNIPVNDGIAYLLSVYYDVKPSYTPIILVQKIQITRIIVLDEKTKTIEWKTPLFENQVTAFSWVKDEYCALFQAIGKAPYASASTSRMKKFFANNPSVRKDDIIGATKMYIRSTDAYYARLPHYFISKGSGADRISDLELWLENYNNSVAASENRQGLNNQMQ